MDKKTKKQIALDLTAAQIGIFRCPKCGKSMRLENTALCCAGGHSFDISKKGYFNLAPQASTNYHRGLFAERREVFQMGFFDGLAAEIRGILTEYGIDGIVLDAGCGEGSLLNTVCESSSMTGVGADLSKEGIGMATDYLAKHWLVADLAALPLADNSCGAVLNVLSPANYGEFARVLKPGGLLVKAIPSEDYLAEIRQFFYGETAYDSEPVPEYFKRHVKSVGERHSKQVFRTNSALLEKIVKMTPLSWGAEQNKRDALINSGLDSVTVSFRILYGVMR